MRAGENIKFRYWRCSTSNWPARRRDELCALLAVRQHSRPRHLARSVSLTMQLDRDSLSPQPLDTISLPLFALSSPCASWETSARQGRSPRHFPFCRLPLLSLLAKLSPHSSVPQLLRFFLQKMLSPRSFELCAYNKISVSKPLGSDCGA